MTVSRQSSNIEVRVVCVPFAIVDGQLHVATVGRRARTLPEIPLEGRALDAAATAACETGIGRKPRSIHQVGAFQPSSRRGQLLWIAYAGLIRDPGEGLAWHPVGTRPRLAAGLDPICDQALEHLRDWTVTGDAVFGLLPAVFSLRELQDAWEAVMDEPVDKRNFRRKVLGEGWVEPASTESAGHRSGTQLYRAARA